MQSQIQISILTVDKVSALTAKGDTYFKLEVNYKDLTNGNKVAKKLVMPFGSTKMAHQALGDAKTGEVFNISQVKNDKGYLDWTGATRAAPGSAAPAPTSSPSAAPAAGGASRSSTYETAEERAQRQVLIVKQSSLSAAVATLAPGSKGALDPAKVMQLAQEYTDFVFGKKAESSTEGLLNLPNDLDDVPL